MRLAGLAPDRRALDRRTRRPPRRSRSCAISRAQHRIVQPALRVAARRARRRPGRAAGRRRARRCAEIISRSCCSRYLATSQPRLTVADQIALRHPHVVEEGLAERRLAGDQQDRLGADTPGEAMSNSMKLMPSCFLARRVGAHQAEDPVGLVGVGGPDLLAVDDEMVAVVSARVCSEARSEPAFGSE